MPETPDTINEYLLTYYESDLRDVIQRTIEQRREHAFQVMTTLGGTPPAVNVRQGQVASISMPPVEVRSPVAIEVHSHPPPSSVGFSAGDWERFTIEYLQYPPVHDYPEGALRGDTVVSQRYGEEDRDVFTVHSVQLTDKGLEMGIEEQQEIVSQMFDLLEDPGMEDILAEQVTDLLGDRITEQYDTLPLSEEEA